MRIGIRFQHRKNSILPFNYQYPLQSWIYHTIANAESAFAERLHNEGYKWHGRSMKLFAFSRWNGLAYKPIKDRGLLLQSDESELTISFLIPEVLQQFIAGLFRDQQYTFYFKEESPIACIVKSVSILEPWPLQEFQEYYLETGARISIQSEENNHPQYMHPDNDSYPHKCISNLIHKAHASGLYKQEIKPTDCKMKIELESVKSQLFTLIKDDIPIKMKTYKYKFDIQAPIAIHQTLYASGLGEECSMGMGWVEKININ